MEYSPTFGRKLVPSFQTVCGPYQFYKFLEYQQTVAGFSSALPRNNFNVLNTIIKLHIFALQRVLCTEFRVDVNLWTQKVS